MVLSGPSGAGKTTAFEGLSKSVPALESNYATSNSHNISSEKMLSKWAYAGHWFKEVWDAKLSGKHFLISDRSPLDSCAYMTERSERVAELTLLSLEELSREGVDVHHVLVTADSEVLQERVRLRTKNSGFEPHRLDQKGDALDRSIRFYANQSNLWHDVIDTTLMTPAQVEKKCTQVALDISGYGSLQEMWS